VFRATKGTNVRAIKVLMQKTANQAKELQTEIEICKKMDHPNIARVYDSWV
jgi:serine/threonine protein kinase